MLLNTVTYRKAEVERQPHNLFIDFSENFLFDCKDKSFQNVNCELPYPMEDPLAIPVDAEDPLKQLLLDKQHFENKLNQARRNNLLKSVQNVDCNKSEYRYMSKGLLEMYQMKDPDEAFKSDYNVYYTNGILDKVHLNGNNYLVWPKLTGTIYFLNVVHDQDTFYLSVSHEAQVCSLKAYSFDKYAYLLLRFKCSVVLLKVTDAITFANVLDISLDKAIIDVKINHSCRSHLGLITINNEFTIRNIKSNKLFFKHVNSKSDNNMIQFEFWKGTKVILMNTFLVQIFDYKSQTILETFDPKLMACNQLCNFRLLDESLLLASRHYVIKTDLNDLKNVSNFAHTLGYAPLYMDLLQSDEEVYLCIANHSQDTKMLFAGKVLYGLPHKVPGIQATLKQTILLNAKFLLEEKLSERLNYSIAGLKLMEHDSKKFIYFVNSLGEIFRQQISYASVDNSEATQKLSDWIEKLNQPNPLLHVTNFAEMGDAFLYLRRPLKHSEKPTSSKSRTPRERFLKKFRPIYSKENMKSTFAQAFFDIWDTSDESEEEEKSMEQELPFYDKVNNWMQKLEPEAEKGTEYQTFDV